MVREIREAIGWEHYMMGCWGIRPEIYRTHLAEAAKRTIPVLFTRPGQVYEVDPSRIIWLENANHEVSGSGPRPFDADQAEYCHLYLQEINTAFENWMVLGITKGFKVEDLRLKVENLGLRKDGEYLVFEFWTKQFLGVYREKFAFPTIDTVYKCQAFCIREKKGRPQMLATNRHISCGGYDLLDVSWSDQSLQGTSRIVGNDRYDIYIYEPEGYALSDFTCDQAEIRSNRKEGDVRVVSVFAEENITISWRAEY